MSGDGDTLRSGRAAGGKHGRWVLPILAMVTLTALWNRSGSSPVVAGTSQGHDGDRRETAAGWGRLKRILVGTYKGIARDRVFLVAAGLTFFGLLAIFPAITALVSIYGLLSDPSAVMEHVSLLSGVLPDGAMDILRAQLDRLVSQDGATLGLGLVLSLGVALWTANGGMKSLFAALNIVHDENEERGFFKLTLVTLGFTVALVLFFVIVLGAIVALPIALQWIGLQADLLLLLRWPLLLGVVVSLLAVVFRYGPDRQRMPWKRVIWGAAVAAVLWLVLSILFSWYVQNFGSYNKTYGSLGAIVGFMTWMWLSWIVILSGAELNAALEHEVQADAPD